MSHSRFAILTFAVTAASYLLLAGTLTATEVLAAVAVAVATTAFVTVQRIRQERPVALRWPPARLLIRTAISLAADTARVGVALLGALGGMPRGAARWQAFHPGGRSPRDAGRRALVTLATSLAPNGFVLDVRPSGLPEAEQGLLLHCLVPTPPSPDPDWPA